MSSAHLRIVRLAHSLARVRLEGNAQTSLVRPVLARSFCASTRISIDVPSLVIQDAAENTNSALGSENIETKSATDAQQPQIEVSKSLNNTAVASSPSSTDSTNSFAEGWAPRTSQRKWFSGKNARKKARRAKEAAELAVKQAAEQTNEPAAEKPTAESTIKSEVGQPVEQLTELPTEHVSTTTDIPAPSTPEDWSYPTNEIFVIKEPLGQNARKRLRRAAEAIVTETAQANRIPLESSTTLTTSTTTITILPLIDPVDDEAAIVSDVLATPATSTRKPPTKAERQTTKKEKESQLAPTAKAAKPRFKARWRDLDFNLQTYLREEQILKAGLGKFGRTGTLETPHPKPGPRPRLNINDEQPARPQPTDRRITYHENWEPWQLQKEALKKKFPEGWKPRKRLSPDALEGIRALHKSQPEVYTTEFLANKFEVSPEAVRRIIKSKWRPSEEEEIKRQNRWFNRGVSVWERYDALGLKPPRKWREAGVGAKRKSRLFEKEEEGEQKESMGRKVSDSFM